MSHAQNTHHGIDAGLVGEVEQLGAGTAVVGLTGVAGMAADDRGLVHGGFTFGLADYAAMLAVNDPNVVLGGADCRFLAPVVVGQRMTATATLDEAKGRKHAVEVVVTVPDADGAAKRVFTGRFTCFVLDQHVLD